MAAKPVYATVSARIDEVTKKEATRVLKSMGLTPAAAFRMMMARVAVENDMPFDILVPNAETVEALEAARRGEGKSFNTVEEMFADLNADD
jgi:DNA-damage-inducible protein J